MEAILSDCVRNSLQQLMYRNAIFMCERLCAEFPTEKNLQLLASCYLQNNQAHCAYHILKGTHLAECRYLFALACFQMDLLNEAESVLSPNESSAEVPNGAAGHYLLGLVYRYTDRKQMAINHFNQALSMDPLLWAAYEELCILGAADEAALVFDDSASIFIQKQYIQRGLASQSSHVTTEDFEVTSNKIHGSEDVSPRKLKHTQGNNLREISGNCYGTTSNQPQYGGPTTLPFYNTPSPMAAQSQLSGVAPPPVCRNALPNGPSMRTYGADNSQRVTINSAVAGPRRKFVDEGKLRKVSERLFSDSGQRRSMRLAGESVNANSSTSIVSGNGTSHSSKYLGGVKSNSVVSRSSTLRKSHPCASDHTDEAGGLDWEGPLVCDLVCRKMMAVSGVFPAAVSSSLLHHRPPPIKLGNGPSVSGAVWLVNTSWQGVSTSASTSSSSSAAQQQQREEDPDPQDLEYVSQIKTVLERLKKNRDMLFNEVKLTVLIEDPRDVERRRLLGIDDENAPTRDDLAEALVQVNEGKIPENRIALQMLAEEMLQWPNLEVEATKKKQPGKSLYAKVTDTGINPQEAAKRLNIDWDSAAEIDDAETDDVEVPPAVGYGALYLVTAFPVIIGISVVLILFYNSLQ